jgi:NAD(P)-dependent dehydrogenase (short-subunit alcohol dehydrogenase family)
MELDGRTVLITGAARGIGRALAGACAEAGARVVASDRLVEELSAVADQLGAGHLAIPCDVGSGEAVGALVSRAREAVGPIDVCFANAGIAVGTDPVSTEDALWEHAWAVNVRQHVWLAQHLLPDWLDRGQGYFVATASAAGLLTQVGSAPYSVTKHAAVAFAEWLSVTYGDQGLRVSCLAPMGVDTAMLAPGESGALESVGSRVVRAAGEVLDPTAVASLVLEAMRDEQFLILPHPEVRLYFERKATDYERWLSGMRRLQAAATSGDDL